MRRIIAFALLSMPIIGGVMLACGDDDSATGTPDAGTDTTAQPDTNVADTNQPPPDTGTDTGTDSGFPPWDYKMTVLANFQYTANPPDLPDGITVITDGGGNDYGTPLVGFNFSARSATTTNTPDGGYTPYSYILGDTANAWPPTQRMTDVHWDPTANVALATVTTFLPQVDAAVPTVGIYKLSTDGGPATLFSQPDTLEFPNSMHKLGNFYYVADSNGYIWRVNATDGTTTKWSTNAFYNGNKNACPFVAPTPRAFGIDGLAVDANNVYVSNFDYGALIKVPINGDGSAGAPTLVVPGAHQCPSGGCGPTECLYQGANGLAVDPDGSFYLSTGLFNVLYRISADGKTSQVIYKGKPPFDFIGNMKVESIKGVKKRLLLTNFAARSYLSDAGPIPQLIQIDLPPSP